MGLGGTAGGEGERSAEEGGLGLAYLFHGLEEGIDEFIHRGVAPFVTLPDVAQPVYVL